MTYHRATNGLLFCGIAIALAYLGPSLDDHSEENAAAKEAIAQQNREARFEAAAREVCGPNAAWRLTHKQGEVVCLTKRNRPTGKVAQL